MNLCVWHALFLLAMLHIPHITYSHLISSPPSQSVKLNLHHRVQSLLMGLYDNYDQATSDAKRGKPTAALGGHEYVTANITQHPNIALSNVLIAQYYLGENPSQTFRFRCYEFCEPTDDNSVRMRLYRPLQDTEKLLKRVHYDVSHPSIRSMQSFALPFGSELRKLTSQQLLQRDFEYLAGCDVMWSYKRSTIPFTSIPLPPPFPRHYNGALVEGSCTICSQQDPTLQLVAKDDLRLYRDRLDINDRVYTLEGKLVIGSADGKPYRMVRRDDDFMMSEDN